MYLTDRNSRTVLGVLAFSIVLFALFIGIFLLQIQPTEDFLKILIEAIVQLFGFGGVILAFVYPAQRSLLRRLRKSKQVWHQRLDQFNHNPKKYQRKGLRREYAETAIRTLNSQIDAAKDASHLGLLAFLSAFVILGIDLTLLIVHIGLYDRISVWKFQGTILGPAVMSIEIPLLIGGITVLLFAVYRGSKLPEGQLG